MKSFFFLVGMLALLAQPVRADLLVLVHGYMADAGTWDASGVTGVLAANGWQPAGILTPQMGGLPPLTPAAAASGNRTYSVNLPAEAPLPIQAAALARQLEMLRRHYPDQRLIVAGHSSGGVVARLLVVGANPLHIDTLIAIASPNLGTSRAADGLDVVDFNPFFCPGPGLEFVKSVLGGPEYSYLEHSRGALVDLLPAESGNILAWLNRQPYPAIGYYAIVRTSPYGPGDSIVPGYSQELNNVAALRGRVKTLFTPGGHALMPGDGQLLADLLASAPAQAVSAP